MLCDRADARSRSPHGRTATCPPGQHLAATHVSVRTTGSVGSVGLACKLPSQAQRPYFRFSFVIFDERYNYVAKTEIGTVSCFVCVHVLININNINMFSMTEDT